ncbi:MAG: chemotaxis protein CheX [Pseudomonadales bacterium]|jgi:hypothetical protein|nr:chemotaxis protein CheX [Pseudomonadales bacterium]
MNLETPSLVEQISDMYAESGRELLSTYGVEATMGDTRAAGSEICSIVSITGPGIKLVSVIQPDIALLKALYPGDASALAPQDIEDWCGEMNNQLAGRIKNKLLNRGCEVMLGIPSQVVGTEVQATLPRWAESTHMEFESSVGSLWAIQLVRLEPEFELLPAGAVVAASDGLMREGEISLF